MTGREVTRERRRAIRLGETWLTHWGKHKVEATRGVAKASPKDAAKAPGIALFGARLPVVAA